MKKRAKSAVFVLCFSIILLMPILSSIKITGHQTSQPTNVSVYVLPAQPLLTIISPENTTYTEKEYILLDYNAILIDTVWYNIDNGQNETINQSALPFYFQEGVGTHTLYLYGNQSNGTILSDNVTFYVKEKKAGGGVRIEPEEEEVDIVLEKEIIEISLRQGEEKQVRVIVKNNEERALDVFIEDLNLDKFLTEISKTAFSLEPGQTEEILVTFKAENNTVPDVYIEKLLIKTEESEKEVSFYVEIESKDILFDVEVFIPEEPAIFYAEDNLTAYVVFYNLGQTKETEVGIEYIVKSPETNEVLFGEKQTIIISSPLTNITKSLVIPKSAEPGDYVFYVKAVYDSKTASASKWFQIIPISPFVPRPIQKAIKAIEKDGPYLAIAIFSLTLLFVGLTVGQILARKYNWFGLGRKSASARAYQAAGGKTRAGVKKSKPKSKKAGRKRTNHESYKRKIRKNLRRIKK